MVSQTPQSEVRANLGGGDVDLSQLFYTLIPIQVHQKIPILAHQTHRAGVLPDVLVSLSQSLLSQFCVLNGAGVLRFSSCDTPFQCNRGILYADPFLVFMKEKGVKSLSSKDCIFCKIVEGEIPAKKVYENEHVVAFEDISPQAPVHVLVIPKKHISSLLELQPEDEQLAAELLFSLKRVAKQLELDEKGFRVVNNIGEDGGQTVYHIHFHLLGGRSLTWPPG